MAELAEGTVVAGRYQVERELARGGMGAVYVAKDLKFAVRCALKVASGAGATDTAALRQRFQREARIANALGKNESFVRVFDWGEVEGSGRLFLAMDLVEDARELDVTSGELPDRLERVETACRVVAQLHRLGVIHRDIKPANFLAGKDGKLRLTDFGIAKNLSEPEEADSASELATQHMGLTGTGMAMGTPYYMPPEQFDDAKSVDARADVYALGVMLFNALAGRVPYAGENASQVLATQMRVRFEGRPAPRPRDFSANIPVALDQAASRAIHLDPAQRFASADELLQALERTEWRKALPRGTTGRQRPPSRTLQATEVDAGVTRAQLQSAQTEPEGRGEGPAGKVVGRRERPTADATISTAPVPAGPPIRPRSELGAGVDHAGVAIPRSVWFIVGLLVAMGLAVNAVPRLRGGDGGGGKKPPPSTATSAPTPGTDKPKREVLQLSDLPDYDRPDAELFVQLHTAWVARVQKGGAPAETTPEESGLFDAGTLGRVVTAFGVTARLRSTTTADGKPSAASEAETKSYRFEAIDDKTQVLRN